MPDREPDYQPMETGDAMILDAVGAQVIRTDPHDQVAILLDLEGKLNRLEVRDAHRYLMSAGQAAELIAELVVAAQHAAAEGSLMQIDGRSFMAELDAAIALEQKRRGLDR